MRDWERMRDEARARWSKREPRRPYAHSFTYLHDGVYMECTVYADSAEDAWRQIRAIAKQYRKEAEAA